MYPEVVLKKDLTYLTLLSRDYLYKDVIAYSNIRSHEAVVRLLQALALQVGQEVSYTELASHTGIDVKTVESYIDILEKGFIIFRLISFSRNLRNELKKSRKIFFWDNGIRNALINNFNPLELRNDVEQLWENFVVSEILKKNSYLGINANYYFWRTYDRSEIDLIEGKNGRLYAYEIKYKHKKIRVPKKWLQTYPNSEFFLISRDNFWDYLKVL